MKHTSHGTPTSFIILVVSASFQMPLAFADEDSPTPSSTASKVPSGLVKQIEEVTEAVLEHHIDPPVRQQMILDAVKALYRISGVPVPAGLGRRVSAVVTPEQLAALLADVWPKSPAKPMSAAALEEALLNGLLSNVPGGAYLMSARERKVAEQLAGNRYVGVQIALAMDDGEKLASISQVFEGGPAERAGAKNGDLIEQIDGAETNGMTLSDVVNRLRGDEGTDVTVKVRQPKAKESRILKMTRASLPRTTVTGYRKRSSGGWDVRLDGPDAVGYLRISDITASTPHELRNMARQLENEGARAIVLDLRGLHGSSVHPTVLIADSLLDHGTIGRVRTFERETTYEADSDALFRGWPMVVLIDRGTWGTAEWLAAALQDNHRAMLVGNPTRGASGVIGSDVKSNVAVGDGTWSIILLTGYLERADGRSLSRTSSSPPSVDTGRERKLNPGDEKTRGGVKPDHPLAVQVVTPEFSIDAIVRKAVELLRESLHKV